MKAMKIISATLAIFVTQPIWIYLQYKILEAVNASDIMWFLFWIYVPVLILVLCLKLVADDHAKG